MPAPSSPNDYPIELPHPDISAHAGGNCGIPYVYRFDAGRPGPHVMISALVHGNELCGAIVLDWLLAHQIRPQRGALSLAFVNTAAYDSFDPADPNASRYVDEDFNRLWSDEVLDSARDSVELRRARELRPIMDTVDLLLDLHSMQHPALPLMMAGPCVKGRELAAQVGIPPTIVTDSGHAAGKRMRDYRAFADPSSPKNALLAECGQHWAAQTGTTAFECALRFLRVTGTVAEDFGGDIGRTELPAAHAWEVTEAVTIAGEAFRFAQAFTGGEVIGRAGTLLGHDDDRPVLTPYDDCMLVMPSKRLTRGLTAVRLARRVG
ncbi:MAG: M14 family metallopeptidase [Burkholderiaceae bacterium]